MRKDRAVYKCIYIYVYIQVKQLVHIQFIFRISKRKNAEKMFENEVLNFIIYCARGTFFANKFSEFDKKIQNNLSCSLLQGSATFFPPSTFS